VIETPLVSIGIPVYNLEDYILETLISVEIQTYSNFEVIIVDDCSTDNSLNIIKEWIKNVKFNVKLYVNEKNQGLNKTCNILLNHSNGKYFQKLDGDDIIHYDKIRRHVEVLENNGSNFALAFSDVELIDQNGELKKEDYFNRIGCKINLCDFNYRDLLNLNFIPNPTILIKTKIIKKIGGYSSDLMFEDWDLWLRLLENNYDFYYDNFKTAKYRIHQKSMMMDVNKKIAINHSNFLMFKKRMMLKSNSSKYLIIKKIKNCAIYSYLLNDTDSYSKLKYALSLKFDFKISIYLLIVFIKLKER
jgi:glycosyltransferase involved in cell wall biosynthesis